MSCSHICNKSLQNKNLHTLSFATDHVYLKISRKSRNPLKAFTTLYVCCSVRGFHIPAQFMCSLTFAALAKVNLHLHRVECWKNKYGSIRTRSIIAENWKEMRKLQTFRFVFSETLSRNKKKAGQINTYSKTIIFITCT